MTTHEKHEENVRKLREMIKGIEFAMLTTIEDDGGLRSRPMATQKVEFDGDLYFFTKASAPKVDEVESDRHVCVSYAAPENQRYVSMSGLARLLRDRTEMEEFWFGDLETWFPHGLEEPDLALDLRHASRVLGGAVRYASVLATGKENGGGRGIREKRKRETRSERVEVRSNNTDEWQEV